MIEIRYNGDRVQRSTKERVHVSPMTWDFVLWWNSRILHLAANNDNCMISLHCFLHCSTSVWHRMQNAMAADFHCVDFRITWSHIFLCISSPKTTSSNLQRSAPLNYIMKSFTVAILLLLSQAIRAEFGLDTRGANRR